MQALDEVSIRTPYTGGSHNHIITAIESQEFWDNVDNQPDEFGQVLSSLNEVALIELASTAIWCLDCGEESIVSQVASSRIKRKPDVMRCPLCNSTNILTK